MSCRNAWLAGCASLLALAAARADEPVPYGSETVVTANRVSQALSDALRPVTVIGARDIEESGAMTLADLLRIRGGVESATSGGPGSASAVFMRGAASSHTLVLVDGMRLSSATTGTTALENIPLAQVERIEIVAGPVSGLYGADAIGGLVQVFTRSGRTSPGTVVSAGIGTENTRTVSASHRAVAGDTDVSLSVAHVATDGASATSPSVSFGRYNPDDDGYRNTSFSGKVGHRFGPGAEVGATVLYSRGRVKFDNGPGSDPRTEQTLQSYAAHGRLDVSPGWQVLLRAGTTRDDNTSVTGDAREGFRTDQDQATWQNTLRVPGGTLVAGAEWLAQDVTTGTAYGVTRRTIRSLFGGYSGSFGAHGVQANVRVDDNSQFGRPGTGTLAYGYRVAEPVRLRASYGTGFHAPTFNDLYYPGFGNAALRPERSRNREVGVDLQSGGQRLAVTAFDNRVSNLIVFFFNPVTFDFLPDNLAEARTRGVELAFNGRVMGTRVGARLTVQDPESLENGKQLQRRARQFGSVTATREAGPWRLGAEVVASGHRFDSSTESPASRMGGYAVANLFVKRALAPGWDVEARWDNVADRKYDQVQGFNTPGSRVMVNLQWTPRAS